MSFASDKLYNGYLRQNMPTIVSRVKVREIIIHLPCLTAHDREIIEAKRETSGNFNGMVLLLDCLKRRENWPEQFIEALEACEHTTIAAEIRAQYNALKGVNNSSPGSPPTTVTRVHVHPAPAASNLPIPESGGAKSQAAVAPPAEVPPAPLEPAAQAPPPPKTPQSAAGQVTEAVSPPKMVPSTPPPSPDIPRAQVIDAPLQQEELSSHQEPETNVEDVSGDAGPIPGEANSGSEVAATPQQQHPVTLGGTATPSSEGVINDRPPQSPAQIISDATDESSFRTMTPEKLPVQDTAPPVNKMSTPVLQPEGASEPPARQIVKSTPKTEPVATTSAEPLAGEMTTSLDDSYLSKPGQLISVVPANPAAQASGQTLEPYSGNTERLELSEAAANTVISTHAPKYSVTALSCQENGVAPNHNEPEENHYESPNESMVQEVVGNISEVPSILNTDGQTTAPHAQLINGEIAKEVISAPPASDNNTGDSNSSCSLSCTTPEPAPAGVSPDLKSLQSSEGKEAPATHITQSTNAKYILTAAGVGACALLMAWRFSK